MKSVGIPLCPAVISMDAWPSDFSTSPFSAEISRSILREGTSHSPREILSSLTQPHPLMGAPMVPVVTLQCWNTGCGKVVAEQGESPSRAARPKETARVSVHGPGLHTGESCAVQDGGYLRKSAWSPW